jgi:hypothetical protein
VRYLNEDHVQGDDGNAVLDDFGLLFRFAQNPKTLMRVGLGARMYHFSGETDAGINFTYSGDVLPADPLTISYEFSAGTLGSSSVFGLRGAFGAVTHYQFEIYAGYDYLDIGSVTIHGPLLGVGYWW